MAISKIGSRAIIDGSVLAADFAPGTITGAKLAGSIGNDKLANSAITIGGEAISLGGTDNSLNLIDWQSVVVSDGSTVTTMVAGRGYFVNNTSAAGIVKLPSSATIGQQIAIKDYAGNFGTNNLTIQNNSHNIQGAAGNITISTNRASLILVYVDSTKGWLFSDEHNVGDLQTKSYTSATGGTVTTSGNDKIHTFTGDGTFSVSSIGNSVGGGSKVSYLVVAGGAGGAGAGGAGGGAGGFREGIDSPVSSYTTSPLKNPAGLTISASPGSYPVTVGGGGTGGDPHPSPGCNQKGDAGSNSVFSTITSAGGGGGGSQGDANPTARTSGVAGGSGGGAGQNSGPPPRAVVGAGNTPPVSPSQGNPGGQGNYAGNTPGSGGGGGATAAGGSSSGGGNAGAGGAGATTHITGSPVGYAGGGGGTACAIHGQPAPVGGAGGSGGGGAARNGSNGAGTAGTTNRGGGGGAGSSPGFCGGSSNAGGAGGSGVVIIRYKYQTG